MGITDDLGISGSIPKIDLTGILSSSWIYIAIIFIVGLLLLVGAAIFFFYLTYTKKVVLFENISGQGFQVVLKTRARIVRLGNGGEELLKTLYGRHIFSPNGKKMGKNTYWFAKAQDGYFFNVVLGDLDAKKGMLDIEPIDRDVRLLHVAIDRLSQQDYGKTNKWEKIAFVGSMFVFLVILILGAWFLIGALKEAIGPFANSAKLTLEVQEANLRMTERLESMMGQAGMVNLNPGGTNTGLTPAG